MVVCLLLGVFMRFGEGVLVVGVLVELDECVVVEVEEVLVFDVVVCTSTASRMLERLNALCSYSSRDRTRLKERE